MKRLGLILLMLLTGCTQAQPELRETKEVQTSIPYSDEEFKTVEDGILCVNEMQHQPANTYDLILMDIQMPNMDGYKATDCIRHLSQPEKVNIPIIAMSANAFEEDKKKAFDVKMNDYITKPIDFQKMEVVLKHVLSKKDPLS